MNKLLTVLMILFSVGMVNGQNSPGADKIAEQDYNILLTKVKMDYPNLAFSPTQEGQLKAVLQKRANEVHILRSNEAIEKLAYVEGYNKIAAKYEDQIKSIMSPEQVKVLFDRPEPTKRRAPKKTGK